MSTEIYNEEHIPSDEEEHIPSDETKDSEPKIRPLNILNFVAYVINVLITYGIGVGGWIPGASTNTELSLKYQTIITPKGTAFSIWGLIFGFQALFVVVQLLPKYRANPLVLTGVSYWYIVTCIAQCGWTFAFSLENIPLSLAFMLAIWVSLISLLISQYRSDNTVLEFWMFRFPFAVHAGWITAASAVNVSVVVVYNGMTAGEQLAVGIISLAVLHGISVWILFVIQKPEYTIALVLAWANGWIYGELSDPVDKIVETFGETAVDGVKYASLAVSIIIVAQVVVRVIWSLIFSIRSSIMGWKCCQKSPVVDEADQKSMEVEMADSTTSKV